MGGGERERDLLFSSLQFGTPLQPAWMDFFPKSRDWQEPHQDGSQRTPQFPQPRQVCSQWWHFLAPCGTRHAPLSVDLHSPCSVVWAPPAHVELPWIQCRRTQGWWSTQIHAVHVLTCLPRVWSEAGYSADAQSLQSVCAVAPRSDRCSTPTQGKP